MPTILTEPPRPAGIRNSRHAPWLVVATVCVGAFMGQLDASIVTVALPHIGRDLHAGIGVVEWVALSYLLVLIATVVTVGNLADAVGRKLLYTHGFGVFTLSSALCGLAPSLPVLIAARVLQALGAAMLQANSVALIAEALPRRALARGIGIQGTAQALGLALGPAVGGLLVAVGGWRLIFLVNLPAGAAGLILGWLLLPRSRSHRHIGRDITGAVLLALAAGGSLTYLSLAQHVGFGSAPLLAALATGLAAAATLVRHERRATAPLVNPKILRERTVWMGLGGGLVSFLILFGTLFVVPYYLDAHRVAPALAGIELAVLPAAIGATAPAAGHLAGRLGTRQLLWGGMVLTGAGLLVIALAHGTAGLLAGLALAGVGLGMFTPSNNASIMGTSPGGHTGVVSGLLNMTRGTGTAIGVAIAGLLYTAAAGVGGSAAMTAAPAAAGRGLTLATAVMGGVGVLLGLLLRIAPVRQPHQAGDQRTRVERGFRQGVNGP